MNIYDKMATFFIKCTFVCLVFSAAKQLGNLLKEDNK